MFILLNKSLISLPTPTSITYMWNWGSTLGLILIIQLLTGAFLASQYNSNTNHSFNSIIYIIRDVNIGFDLRAIHSNGASVFFILIYIHIRRGVLQSSFKYKHTWFTGLIILISLIAIAFIGYVLPWGQISFWGATVITNLIRAIPYLGGVVVTWLWGGFCVGNATLTRFFIIHFFLPFILIFLVVTHLTSLHITGSNKPLGNNPSIDKIMFQPFFYTKDLITLIILIIILLVISIYKPFFIGDPENFNIANPLNTPIHIQPEWYFLFAYSILRSIPNKLGGVIGLFMSILLVLIISSFKKIKLSKKIKPSFKWSFWLYAIIFSLLTWIGAKPIEPPFEKNNKFIRFLYFTTLIIN